VSIHHKALIERFADIMSRNEWDALSSVFTGDAVLEFPQSGEVFRGIRNIRGQYENYPGGLAESRTAAASIFAEEPAYALTPTYTVIAVEGTGKRGAATFRTQYPDGSKWWAVTHFETDGDRISHSQVFFAPEFEGPEWRAPFREAPPRN
jgi:ketosteroid isomerase-like protein